MTAFSHGSEVSDMATVNISRARSSKATEQPLAGSYRVLRGHLLRALKRQDLTRALRIFMERGLGPKIFHRLLFLSMLGKQRLEDPHGI